MGTGEIRSVARRCCAIGLRLTLKVLRLWYCAAVPVTTATAITLRLQPPIFRTLSSVSFQSGPDSLWSVLYIFRFLLIEGIVLVVAIAASVTGSIANMRLCERISRSISSLESRERAWRRVFDRLPLLPLPHLDASVQREPVRWEETANVARLLMSFSLLFRFRFRWRCGGQSSQSFNCVSQ